MKLFYFFLCAVIGIAAYLCVRKPKIVVKNNFLLDHMIDISVVNLLPYQHIQLQSSCKDYFGNEWRAQAHFQADSFGAVHVSKQASLYGSYTGIDPMGLLWSMVPTDEQAQLFFVVHDVTVTLSCSVKNKICDEVIVQRSLKSDSIIREEVTEQDFAGTYFYPKHTHHLSTIVVVSGSNGGIPESVASLLASHGYAVLALGYFGAPGLPEELVAIELDYFKRAIDWLKKRPETDHKSVTLIGNSRGGELVLLLAATFVDDIRAVVAYVPSSIVGGGFPYPNQPAWIYQGKAFEFMPALMSTEKYFTESQDLQYATDAQSIPFHANTQQDPYVVADLFTARIGHYEYSLPQTSIAVEKIQCPMLLFSGTDDKIWPSSWYCQNVMKRLHSHNSSIKRYHVDFPSAGHDFIVPYIPSFSRAIWHPWGKFWCVLGGTMQANAQAAQKSWRLLLEFLANNSLSEYDAKNDA